MMLTGLLLLLAWSQSPGPTKTTLPDASNVTRVDAVLMCGGATGAGAFPALRKEGFVSVINLRQADEPAVDIPRSRAAAEAAGLRYIHLPVARTGPDTGTVEAFLRAVTDKANQPMYIHCGSANRVAALWLIKRVAIDGWDVPRAADEATAIGLTSDALRQFALDYLEKRKQ